jgi:plastocyanin
VGLENTTELFSTQTINIPNALSVEGGEYFLPVNAQVIPNSNVTFTNNDNFVHSAIANGGGGIFNTGNIKPGDSATVTISSGVIPYDCGIHPWMTGSIVALSPGTQPQNASSIAGGYQIQPHVQPQPPGSITGG